VIELKNRKAGFYYSVVLALAILFGTGLIPDWGWWYSNDSPFSMQTGAMLKGHLSLASTPAAMDWDLVWDHGAVQQVWGLGVPAWYLIFEVPARLLGSSPFPDRISFGIALFFVIYAFVRLAFRLHSLLGTRMSWIPAWLGLFTVILFPPFLQLCCMRFRIYEQAVAYGYLTSALLMLWTVRLWFRPGKASFLALALVSGFMPFIRPTFGVYGLASIIVGGAALWRRDRGIRVLCLGGCLFCFGLALLLWSNAFRFGSPLEFGHSLNMNGLDAMCYASRFDYPFRKVPLTSAAKELGAALFLAVPQGATDGYRLNIYPGQSPVFRWREFYFKPFDISMLVMGVIICSWLCFRMWSRLKDAAKSREPCISEPLVYWAALSALPLSLFYLRFPFLSARYLMDFGPAFAAGSWALCWLIADRIGTVKRHSNWLKWYLLALVLSWWGMEISTIEIDNRSNVSNLNLVQETNKIKEGVHIGDGIVRIPTLYTNGFNFTSTSILYNGRGWEETNTSPCVALFMDNPDCIELEVGPAKGAAIVPRDYECIQAKIGLEHLERESLTPLPDRIRIVFRGPKNKRYQTGIQVAFIGMVSPEELSDDDSRFCLLKAAWHRTARLSHNP
jgi:hypothetical protein